MNYKDNFHAVVKDQTKLVNQVADLQTENLLFFQAAKHFFECSVCHAEDFDRCDAGKNYALELDLLPYEKAV